MSFSPSANPSPICTPSSDNNPRRRQPRVSAEHTLNRVRENQRRHRARQKDHVAFLERKLAETERQLADAKAEIEALKAERDTANAFACYDISKHLNIREERVGNGVETESLVASLLEPAASIPLAILPVSSDAMSPTVLAVDTDLLLSSAPFRGPPPCCTDIVLTSSSATASVGSDPECSTCKTRPPPSPSESTTLCAQAFVMISQQNFRNLDPGMIRLWLTQGYRRALKEGEGCRVENGTLLRLLDYISGI